MHHTYCQMTTCWTRIDHGTAVEVQNGRGRYSRRHNDVNSRRLSRCPRNPAGRCERPSPRTPASACAWSKCGSRISEQRWRSFRERRKPSRDPTRNRKRSEGRKVRTAITVRALFHPIHIYLTSENSVENSDIFSTRLDSRFLILKFLVDPEMQNFKYHLDTIYFPNR